MPDGCYIVLVVLFVAAVAVLPLINVPDDFARYSYYRCRYSDLMMILIVHPSPHHHHNSRVYVVGWY